MMEWQTTCVLVAVLVVAGGVVDGAGKRATNYIIPGRILFLSPAGPRSHVQFFSGIIDALTQHGHQLTLVSPHKIKERANVRQVRLDTINLEEHYRNAFTDKQKAIEELVFKMADTCIERLSQQNVQDLLMEEFDVILINSAFSQCFLSFVHHMKVPFVWVSPLGMYAELDVLIGNPMFQSLGGNVMLDLHHPLTFFQRFYSAFYDLASLAFGKLYMSKRMDRQCRSHGLCPSDMPPLNDIGLNASLVMTNSVRTMDSPKPHVPGIIPIGGSHCRPANPLPKELEEWVEGSGENGFILFSLGSAVRASDMPEEYRQVLVQVFGTLKQRVLWKWEEDNMPDMPPNVLIVKWLPQQDILGHQSLRLFITHGGRLSTYEAAYHGVPILGLPVMLDQEYNMMQVTLEGWGQIISWEHLTQDLLAQTIRDIMANQSIAVEAERRSSVMRDQPIPPGEVAAYWIEYVMRHQGAPHLRSPILDMYWYEVYNVDVWLAVVVVTTAVLGLILALVVMVCRRLWATKKHKSE